MKKNLFFVAGLFLSMATFVSCSEEDNLVSSGEFTVKAAMETESRTSLGDDHSTITWSDEDRIYLFGGNSKATLRLVNGAGTGYGEFRGAVNGPSTDLNTGLYPVPAINGDEYSYDFPSTRDFSENSAAPMLGNYSDGVVQFQNLVALIRVPLSASDKGRELKLNMEGIAGKLVVDIENGTASMAEGATNEVIVNVPAGESCYVDIPVPAKQYSTCTVLLDGEQIAEKTEAFELEENDVVVILTAPNVNEEGEFVIENSADLMWVAKQINEGNTFAGKTLKVVNDIDLNNVKTHGSSFTPVGDYSNYRYTFEGTLDGGNHTISNLYQSGWDFGYDWYNYGSLGLFSYLNNATIKNLKIEGFEGQIEGGDIAFVAGSATGTCVFENIEIKNSKIGTYNNGIGSIIGWSGAGSYTFKNITIENDVVLGGLWGSFDSSIGGLIGQADENASYLFEDCVINCRLDAYNDVTASYQWYSYRMCGMIIGRVPKVQVINGTNYPDPAANNITCVNVTVNYGDWMNYHYCFPGGNSRATRVEAGYAYEGHNHNSDCKGTIQCIPFNQIFGGLQSQARVGYYGLEEYSGVTVNYPTSYKVEVSSAASLKDAISKGKSVILNDDIDLGTTQLAIDKPVVIDLNEKTLTTSMAYGGISMKNGASIKNGIIEHTSTVAAIKAFNVGEIEDVTIKTTCGTANKTITAIAVQQGGHVGSIKNVTIEGVSQGIEVGYQATVDFIEGTVVDMKTNGTANGIGLVINGGKVGKATGCTFKGEAYGVTMHLKGVFAVGLELEECEVTGTTASINAWDEKGISNTSGSLTLTLDNATSLNGPFIWDFEDECKSVITLNKQ